MCAFRQDIEGSSLIQNPAGGSVDEMIEQYNSTLTKVLDKHAFKDYVCHQPAQYTLVYRGSTGGKKE